VRLRVAQVLLAAAALAAVLAMWAWLTGGFRVRALGVPISVRGEHRAAFIALVLAAVGLYLHSGLRQRLAALRADPRVPPFSRWLLPAVVVAATAVLCLALVYGSRAAGGSDPYGYVSQADLWRAGTLRIRQPFAASVPWPDGEWTFSPLGYKPSDDQTIVPTYAPGYPLLMALFALVFGAPGAFYVAPACGAALVLLTYALGARLSGPVVGTIAALSIACSPAVLFMTLSVMSDIPVAAFWAAAILLATRRTAPAALAAGVVSGIAIVIRPNLVFAAIVPLLVVAWPWPDRAFWPAFRRAVVFGTTCAPFALFIGWLFNDLYGSPLRSGYGDNASLFALEHVAANVARYPAWLLETQGPLVYLFLLSPFIALWRGDRSTLRWFFMLFVALIVGSYLLYLPFDAWWYLRFLLPVFPFLFILAADAAWMTAGRLAPDTRNLAMALFTIVMVGVGLRNSDAQDVLAVGRGEEKYIEVARYLNQTLPTNAVIYSLQHSGSVRYYSGRLTLRYDYLAPDWLDRSIAYLQQAGYQPVFVLDNWELPLVRERFASQQHVTLFAHEPKEAPCTHTTYLYRVTLRPGEPAAVRVPAALGCR
jgi:hypothetical protein